jgi:sigma-B regulation protein RsbU (phosphoserine phosphatase)
VLEVSTMTDAPTEHETEQLPGLLAVTDPALTQLDIDDLLVELTRRVRDLMAADTAAVLLVDPSGRDLIAMAATGLEEEVRLGVRVPIGEGFAGRIAASGQPLVIDHVDHTTVVNQILIDEHLTVMAGVPNRRVRPRPRRTPRR